MKLPLSYRHDLSLRHNAVAFFACCFLLLCAPQGMTQDADDATRILMSKSVEVKTNEAGEVISLNSQGSRQLTDDDMPLVARHKHVQRLDLENNLITDRGFAHLAPLENVEQIFCCSTRITDGSLAHMKKWGKLRMLVLPPSITDGGLRSLPELPHLEQFFCFSPHLTDDCIDVLLGWRQLRCVRLGDKFTPAGYERLSRLPNLEFVGASMSMDDSIMAVLTKFPKLRQLDLDNMRVTEAGLPHLADMKALESLTLPDETTDGDLRHISKLSKLERLYLRKTAVTNKGIRELRGINTLHSLTLPPTTGDDCLAMLVESDSHIAYLELNGEGYTDKCIDSLIALKWLTNMALAKTNITQRGLGRLKAARPEIRLLQ